MPLRRIAFVLALPLAVACAAGEEDPLPADDGSPVVPFHEISAPAPEEEDSDAIDVRTSLDERPNMRAVARWDFEPASADCNGWSASGATAIRAIPSHTGSYACKLCANGSAAEMKLTRRVAGLPRGSWVVSAWLRRLSTSPVALAARVTLDEASERAGVPISLDQDWRLLGEPVQIPHDVASTSLTIVATATAGQCILVDDVLVESATARTAHSSLPATPYVFMSR
jgi:hypothetical protein